ncbi:MAG: TonB-dependent receptor [Pseudomonadota bacterium]|nr:TonB-dependent receptor [Pseudomonadota bacterium]
MLDGLPPSEPTAETIVVTARALPDPESMRAYSVEAFDAGRLRNSPSSQLDEVLKRVPGLQLFRRSDARSGHPTSQGATLRALGGNASSRALLILDGVPQADPFGGWINWPSYDPAALAEVRVIRGGGSVTHGPGALAGVIEMVSGVEQGLSAGVDAGSRSSVEGRLQFGTGFAGGQLGLSGRGARGSGFVPITEDTRGPADQPAPYKEASIRGQWMAPLGSDIELQASASGITDRRSRGLDFTGNRTDGADAALRLVGRGSLQWSALAYYQWRELESSFANVSPGRLTSTRVSLQDAVPSQALGGAFEIRPPIGESIQLRLGADARSTVGESRELFSFVAGEPTRRRIAGGTTFTGGAFGELTAGLGRLTLSGGARLDHWRIADGELREWTLATNLSLRDEQYRDRSGWLPTARVGTVLDVGRGWHLRSAAYLAWRMPTLNELFRPFRAGLDATAANPRLDPEKLAGIEIGASFRRPSASLELTAFVNRLSDPIANVTLGEGPGVFPNVGFVAAGGEFRQRRNLDAIRVYGIEASGEARKGPWSFRGGASIVDAEVRAQGPAAPLDGLRPAQTPRVVLTAAVAWERGRRAASLLVRHSGSQFEDDLNQRKLPSGTTVDGSIAWPVTGQLQLVARGENLLNHRMVAGIGGDGSIERATPRTLWVGLRFSGPSSSLRD